MAMKVDHEPEKIKIPSTTFDVTCVLELTFEIPTTQFNTEKIHDQLVEGRHRLINQIKLNKDALARILGMESTKFLFTGNYQHIDITKITITRYDTEGKVIRNEDADQ